MKDSTLLMLAGGAVAGYYFLVLKPQQELGQAFAGGAGAVSAIPGALGEGLAGAGQGITNFFNSLFAPLQGLIPNAQAAPQPVPQVNTAANQAKAAATWIAAGGTVQNGAYIMPTPAGQIAGLTIQQPAITNVLTKLAGSGSSQPLATVTTLADVTRVLANQAAEVKIKAEAPGNTVIGHRTQGGVEIYTLKNKATGAISIVRK